MAEGVSFGARGNLLFIAPPLVIDERELADALAVLDRLLQRHFAGSAPEDPPMSFRLTYATMFNPPEEMHAAFRGGAGELSRRTLGREHALFIDGKDVPGAASSTSVAARSTSSLSLGVSRSPTRRTSRRAVCSRRTPRFRPGARRASPKRAAAMRRVARLMEARVYEIAAALTLEVGKNRMEALGEAQEMRRLLPPSTPTISNRTKASTYVLPNDPLERRLAQPQRACGRTASGR